MRNSFKSYPNFRAGPPVTRMALPGNLDYSSVIKGEFTLDVEIIVKILSRQVDLF